jgi:glycosyltransferase involved in cell wall biosynthesis
MMSSSGEFMTDVSLISSFYRAAAHLPEFFQRARQVAREVAASGVSLEFVIVANDAQPDERALIDTFAADTPNVRVLYVGRESLYASWNRGIKAAAGQVIGFWNADDARTAAGILDGVQRMRGGCEIVYFAYEIHNPPNPVRLFAARPVDEAGHRRRMEAGPFFLFRRDLFERVGRFDDRFRVVGDWEWIVRALGKAKFCHSTVNAGAFYIHGGNLSNTGNQRELTELAVVRLLHGMTGDLTPVPPEAMRDVWQGWAHQHPLPPHLEDQLWGSGAQDRWEQWQAEAPKRRQAALRSERLRAIPKRLIDIFGLRPLLARFGLVKARPA